MKPQISLKDIYFEEINLKLPSFFMIGRRIKTKCRMQVKISIFRHKKDTNRFALRYKLSSLSDKNKKIDIRIKISAIGMFEFEKNTLNAQEKIKILKIDALIKLDKKIKEIIMPFLNNSVMNEIKFPTVKNK